jgi:hypothetical protein
MFKSVCILIPSNSRELKPGLLMRSQTPRRGSECNGWMKIATCTRNLLGGYELICKAQGRGEAAAS